MHTWTAKNWMQCSVSHVATMALHLSQNGLRSNLRASNLKKFSWGSTNPDPPSLSCFICMCTYTSNIHVTPLLKILAIGLCYTHYKTLYMHISLLHNSSFAHINAALHSLPVQDNHIQQQYITIYSINHTLTIVPTEPAQLMHPTASADKRDNICHPQ